jgi:hypothetical protein
MLRGLVHETADGPQVSNAYTATDTTASAGGNSEDAAVTATAVGANAETAASVTSTSSEESAVAGVNSHLDSFFSTSALTREDVLVVAAVVQTLAWVVLLYLEVRE